MPRPRIIFERLHPKAVWPKLCPRTEATFELCAVKAIGCHATAWNVSTGIGITLPRGRVGIVQTDPFAISKGLIVTAYPHTWESSGPVLLHVQVLHPKPVSMDQPGVLIPAGHPLAMFSVVRAGELRVVLVDARADSALDDVL